MIELLFERPGLPVFGISAPLAARYGSDLGFAAPRLYANLVSSVDGVVALHSRDESGHLISGGSEADRFVMALLRACADAVLVGAGTFRKAPGHLWHAESVFPNAAKQFTDLRKGLGLRPTPPLVLVTASGDIDTAHPALRDALIVTTPAGEQRLRGKVPPGARLTVLDSGTIRLAAVIRFLHGEGLRVVLTEGGPSLLGRLVAEELLDELFLTTSPVLFGRSAGDGRKSLIDAVDVAGTSVELLSARRHGSYLFLRYGVAHPAPVSVVPRL
jgi:riboflavin biosynthesis pyrimidine reductase